MTYTTYESVPGLLRVPITKCNNCMYTIFTPFAKFFAEGIEDLYKQTLKIENCIYTSDSLKIQRRHFLTSDGLLYKGANTYKVLELPLELKDQGDILYSLYRQAKKDIYFISEWCKDRRLFSEDNILYLPPCYFQALGLNRLIQYTPPHVLNNTRYIQVCDICSFYLGYKLLC